MLLNEVLLFLYDKGNGHIEQVELYYNLFVKNTGIGEDDSEEANEPGKYVNIAKNRFRSNPSRAQSLTGKTTKIVESRTGFSNLCRAIDKYYLNKIGDIPSLISELIGMLKEDSLIPEDIKNRILESIDDKEPSTYARFIALCILCSNRNKKGEDYDNFILSRYLESPPTDPEIDLWERTCNHYKIMHTKGNRFAFDIIESILPKGYIAPLDYDAKASVGKGHYERAIDICLKETDHLSIVGDGGIGKTVLLQKLMGILLQDGQNRRTVPFFIELNRCPRDVEKWYDEPAGKTNFITRYIAMLCEEHTSMDNVKPDTMILIDREFNKIPEDGNRRYLLLLDGFNEVYSGKKNSIRSLLSDEITILSRCPNVRIITTSRKTQTAHYALSFKNVPLIGLEDDGITDYLAKCKYNTTEINQIRANTDLMECLRIPLHICMFCAGKSPKENTEQITEYDLPQTAGEIFYNFIHRDGTFYNVKKRVKEAKSAIFDEKQIIVLIDLVLPYIGWHYENEDIFDMSRKKLSKLISDAVDMIHSLCASLEEVPFRDFTYETNALMEALDGLDRPDDILGFLQDYLGLLYFREDTNPNVPMRGSERLRYSFCHHRFRDYFSAMWDVQMLRLLPYIEAPDMLPDQAFELFEHFTNIRSWSSDKTTLISEILMEHRNRPILDTDTNNWMLPEKKTQEQTVIAEVLNYCRRVQPSDYPMQVLLQNVLSCLNAGRGELSGEDLQGLNLEKCNFFHVTCSHMGKTQPLPANFRQSSFSRNSFVPESHQDSITDHLYFGDHCYTLDMSGVLKCWDTGSGRLLDQVVLNDSDVIIPDDAAHHMKFSPDRKWMAVIQKAPSADGIRTGITCFYFMPRDSFSESRSYHFAPGKHQTVNDFFFTDASDGILLLCDNRFVYGFKLEERKDSLPPFGNGISRDLIPCFQTEIPSLFYGTLLQMDSIHDDMIIYFTAHYIPSLYDRDDHDVEFVEYGGDYYYEEDVSDEEEFYPCEINAWQISEGTASLLHSFIGLADFSPTIAYLPGIHAFVYLDGETQGLCAYHRNRHTVATLLVRGINEEGFLPSHIHPHEADPSSFYVAYPDQVALVKTDPSGNAGILMSALAKNVAGLLNDTTDEIELSFLTEVPPCGNRFLLKLDTITYEWNAARDTLDPRYNISDYTVVTLLPDPHQNSLVLVHRNNGISVFDGDTKQICRSVCFHEPEYYVEDACMHPRKSLIALTFARADHEKIMLLNLVTGETQVCFSSKEPGETILTIEFSSGGAALLIVTQYACHEYILKSGSLHTVKSAGEGERIADGGYDGKEIEIVFTPDKTEDAPHIVPRCEYHSCRRTASNAYYNLLHYYEIDPLRKELAPYFVFAYNDLGVQGPLDDQKMQEYWITGGMFLEISDETDGTNGILLPELKYYNALTRKHYSQPVKPFQKVYFSHSFHLTNTGGGQHPPICKLQYDWIDSQNKQAVFIDNEKCLYRSDDLFCETYHHIRSELEKNRGSYSTYSGWDHVIPWHNRELICCHEGYRLMSLDAQSGEKMADMPYEPGIAVCGCDFRDSHIPESLKEMLRQNGALI